MKPSNDADQNFHDNLQTIGRQVSVPSGVSPHVRAECAAQLGSSPGTARVTEFTRNRKLFPAIGLAASLILTAGLLFMWSSGPTVQAAEILAALNEQLQDSRLIELTIDSMVFDEVSISGNIQISDDGVAGDINVTVTEGGGKPPIHVDASLGFSADGGWVLVRELDIPDPQVQAILAFVLPAGTETLIMLPKEMLDRGFHHDIDETLQALGSESVTQVLEEIIASASDTGMTVTPQRDGTLLLTIHFDDQEAIAAMGGVIAQALRDSGLGDFDDIRTDEDVEDIENALRDEEDLQKLVGGTVKIVYDQDAGLVRSFSVEDIGEMKGSVTVAIRSGTIDPDLLDASRVTTPSTRTLDLAALQSMFDGFDGNGRAARKRVGAGRSIDED
ncbi:MAG: hypothetical protein IH987_04545 [Planctomycetes bacterium]|nr:hypothetical protein [Planctomycetota bacterium]